LIFYESTETTLGLVVEFTDEDSGAYHYLPEVRAGKRLADPKNKQFASLFVDVLNRHDGADSTQLQGTYRQRHNLVYLFTLTVMERTYTDAIQGNSR
jgi:hypothetical protein